MQSLDDDMDELFRRVGEEYPLNTSGADWSMVMKELHEADAGTVEQKNKKKDYKYLLLLLLLPIGFVCGRYVGNNDISPGKNGSRKEVVAKEVSGNNSINSTYQKQANASVGDAATNPVLNYNGTGQKAKENQETSTVNSKKESSASKTFQGKHDAGLSFARRSDKVDKVFKKEAAKRMYNSGLTTKTDNTDVAAAKLQTTIQDQVTPIEKGRDSPDTASSSRIGKTLQTDPLSAVKSNQSNMDSLRPAQPAGAAKKAEKDKQTFRKSLYFSIIAGPDLSTIKFGRTSRVGYTIGVLLDYQLSKRLAVQTGALWDRKSYFSKGDYFDTSRLKLPMHTKILNGSGLCDMIEIPVNIKYDFISKPRFSWFVSAGASSYIMKKEDYSLNVVRYNQYYLKDYGYKNSSKDWLSIMNLSVGYQKTLGKQTNISIAPYLKVPLRGVGIGKLPISSTGIYIGYTRSLR